ncbi:MAG TPA: hypothetical protein VK974_05210 [Methylophilaceae bacterium]|nr:hypothetical protein [Methylophilaceae bacterium]
MSNIQVEKIDATTFKVQVSGKSATTHMVTVKPDYAEKLTGRKLDLAGLASLVEKSFEFLLEREPNTSILRSFELSVIGQYFPEYERVIREKIKS